MNTKRFSLWWKDEVANLLPPYEEVATETSKRRRTLDFSLVAGRITARFQDEAAKIYRAEFTPRVYTSEEWETICAQMSNNAFALCSLLAGTLPESFRGFFASVELPLFPQSAAELRPRCECGGNETKICRHLSVLLEKTIERFEEDLFSVFLLRGFSRDELILELKRRRSDETEMFEEEEEHRPSTVGTTGPVLVAPQPYYSARKELFSFSYSLRADELPASILKRLDPVPLGDALDDIDFQLEEAYGQVARRAQVYALSLVR